MAKKPARGRGRPTGSKADQTREELFQIKLFPEELAAYEKAAKSLGLNRSAWARLVLNQAAKADAQSSHIPLTRVKKAE